MPTVFENYTASFEIDKQRIELNMWDTSGKTISHLCLHRLCEADIKSIHSPSPCCHGACPWLRPWRGLLPPTVRSPTFPAVISLTNCFDLASLRFFFFSLGHLLFMIVVFARNFGASHVSLCLVFAFHPVLSTVCGWLFPCSGQGQATAWGKRVGVRAWIIQTGCARREQ